MGQHLKRDESTAQTALISVRNQRYRIASNKQAKKAPKAKQEKLSAADILSSANAIQPSSWLALWQLIKPTGSAMGATSPNEIKGKIAQLIDDGALVALRDSSGSANTGTGGAAGSSGSKGGSASSAANGPAVNIGPQASTPRSQPAHADAANSEPAKGGQTENLTELQGEPISMVTGEEMLSAVDAVLPGPIALTFKRSYRSSQTGPDHVPLGLGKGWRHSASSVIDIDRGTLSLTDDEGRVIRVRTPSIGQKSRYLPEQMTLIRESAGSILLKQDGQPDRLFLQSGSKIGRFQLKQIRHQHYRPADPNRGAHPEAMGYCLTLHHNARAQLTRVSGNWGRSLIIERDGDLISGLLLRNDETENEKRLASYHYENSDTDQSADALSADLTRYTNARGHSEHYRYQNHLLIERKLVSGYTFNLEWDGSDHRAKCLRSAGENGTYDYRFSWQPDQQTSSATDSRGYTTYYQYNAYGQVVQQIDNEGGKHRREYKQGRLTAYTNPLGHETSYLYNSHSQLTGALNHKLVGSHIQYFKGKQTRFSDANGNTWKQHYNRAGQLVRVEDPYGRLTQFRYNAQGLLETQTDANGLSTHYRWNVQGDCACIIDPRGHERRFSYDEWGQLTEILLVLNGSGKKGLAPIKAGSTHIRYSDSGQVIGVTTPSGENLCYDYNELGLLTRFSDGHGRVTSYRYDRLSQVVERTDPEGHTLGYEYDSERNLIALVNEKGERHRFAYDGCERLIKETGFDGRVQEYRYDQAGHLIEHIDAGEVSTRFERDCDGRMLSRRASSLNDPAIPEELTRFRYDANGNLVESYNNEHYLTFAYDAYNQITQETNCPVLKGSRQIRQHREVSYEYRAPGLLNAMHLPGTQPLSDAALAFISDSNNLLAIDSKHSQTSHPDVRRAGAQSVRFDYNAFSELTAIQLDKGPQTQQIASFSYDALGRETHRQQGSLSTYRDYDPQGRLLAQRSEHQSTKAAGPIAREYQYGALGNLEHLREERLMQGQASRSEHRYLYDFLDRLTQVDYSHQGLVSANDDGSLAQSFAQREVFAFDPANNLVNISDAKNAKASASDAAKGNRLAFQADKHFTYDARGNLIEERRGKAGKLSTHYVYNLQNQLISCEKRIEGKSQPSQQTHYRYDPLGRRTSKTDNFGTTTYLWAGDQMVRESRGASIKTYVYEPATFLPVAMLQDDETYHYHVDQLGTPKELTNEQGKIVWQASYQAYGNTAIRAEEGIDNPLRFQGQYFDKESGLHYNRHRYYHPDTGQFTTQDPIGLLGGINNYQYAPNPTGWVDPYGLSSKEIACSREEFNSRFPTSYFSLPSPHSPEKQQNAAWKVYQDTSLGSREIIMGRMADTAVGAELGFQKLTSDVWSLGVNDAWVQGGIDAKKHFYLGSPIKVKNLRTTEWPHDEYGTTVFMRELKQLRGAGYVKNGDYMMPGDT